MDWSARGHSERRRVPINWDDLETALTSHGDEQQSYLDPRTGEVHDHFRELGDDYEFSIEKVETGLSEGYLLRIEPLPSSIEYGWMATFAASAQDPHLRELLDVALRGRGAFRRFKQVLSDRPEERERWFAFRDERMRHAMKDWLAEHDIEPEGRE